MSDQEPEEQEPAEAGKPSVRVPPYISFATFLTFLKDLKTNGVPPQIDKSVMSKMSGGAQSQMKIALRSLSLVNGDKPTDDLKALVDAYETADFDTLLYELLKEMYPYVFALDLMSATPTMFAEAFKVTGAKEDVLRKCRTFFLHAAKRVGVPLGQRILTGTVPRTPSTGNRRKTRGQRPADTEVNNGVEDTSTANGKGNDASLMGKLLDKFPSFDPTWPDDIKAKWFANFEQFMKASKAK